MLIRKYKILTIMFTVLIVFYSIFLWQTAQSTKNSKMHDKLSYYQQFNDKQLEDKYKEYISNRDKNKDEDNDAEREKSKSKIRNRDKINEHRKDDKNQKAG